MYTLKTKITNNLDQDLFLRWLGKHGEKIPANGSIILDEAYPSCVQNKRLRPECENHISRGIVQITLITDFPVEKPAKEKAPTPTPASATSSSANTVVVDTTTTETAEAMGAGTMEDYLPKKITLPGHEEITEIPDNRTKVFATDPTLTHEEVSGVKEASSAKPLEEPAVEVSKPKKTTRRRKTKPKE